MRLLRSRVLFVARAVVVRAPRGVARRTRTSSSSPASPATRSTPSSSTSGRRRSSTRRRRRTACPTRTSRISAEKPELDAARIRGRSTRESVEKAVADIAAKARPERPGGHPADRPRQLRRERRRLQPARAGPDGRRVGGAARRSSPPRTWPSSTRRARAARSCRPWPRPAATVVTATKTGGERNETKFAEFFVKAFGDDAADADRNGHVSMQRSVRLREDKVVEGVRAGRAAAHRARRRSTMAAAASWPATQFLDRAPADGGSKVDTSDPAMRALVAERDAIEKQIDALKLKKTRSMDRRAYDAEMERLLTDLALKTRAIRDLQAKKEPSHEAGRRAVAADRSSCSGRRRPRAFAQRRGGFGGGGLRRYGRSSRTRRTTGASRSCGCATARRRVTSGSRSPGRTTTRSANSTS